MLRSLVIHSTMSIGTGALNVMQDLQHSNFFLNIVFTMSLLPVTRMAAMAFR